jgi:preprotein translocase subunit SecF
VTGELRYHALLAMGVAMVVQFAYIFLRFGFQARYGTAAVVAILHDVVIMIGMYSLSGRQLDSPFVAALLTVAGYSIMDSVVIFDRIRENEHYYGGKKPFPEVVNESVNQTMSRSVNTTLTVLITLVAIYFFGGTSLQSFAYSLLVGITSGAYSSVFVAAPTLILVDRYFKSTPKAVVSYAAKDEPYEPVYQEGAPDESAPAATRRRVRGTRRRL